MSSENRRPVVSATNDKTMTESSRLAANKRLQKELMEFVLQSDQTISAFPDGDDLFRWIATITGPKDTVFEGLKYKLLLTFSAKYPFCPPIVVFLNHCFHPNISSDGDICLDILKEPNLESPLDAYAAQMWGHNDYKQIVLLKYSKSVNDSNKSK